MGKPRALVDKEKCLACGGCISICPQDAIKMCSSIVVVIEEKCIDCGICIQICPIGAIKSGAF